MEAAGLRERTASFERLRHELQGVQTQAKQTGDDKAHALTQLQQARSRVAELELEVSALKERVIEADRLQHELQATREKMRVMEQRTLLLDKERAGAAAQLEAELEAARSKIQAIDARRKGRGRSLGVDDGGSTIVSSLVSSASGATGRPARSASPRGGPLPSGTPGYAPTPMAAKSGGGRGHARDGSASRSRAHETAAGGTGKRDRYVGGSPRGGGGGGGASRRPPRSGGGGGGGRAAVQDEDYSMSNYY